jgi:peptide/nickel transport system ATP-binding protein
MNQMSQTPVAPARDSAEEAALLTVRNLRIRSQAAGRTRNIVTDLNFDARSGETLGIVGESGSGKSLTARTLVGLLPDGLVAEGEIRYDGRDLLGLRERELARIRGSEIALILQDPFTTLNPLMRCGTQIVELLRDRRGKRLSRRARRHEAERRLAEVGIEDPAVADAYPFELSGGMRQRVGIAAALARDPKILIADEPSTALDVTTQREILDRLKELQAARGMSLILITHDLRVAFSVCDRIAVLYAGSLLETGPAAEIEGAPLHPYTQALLLSEPPIDRKVGELPTVAGGVPTADEVAGRCAFAPRCKWCQPRCEAAAPPLAAVSPTRSTACIRQAEIGAAMRRAPWDFMADVITIDDRPHAGDLVRMDGVGKAFGGPGDRRRQVDALKDVTVSIREGESVGLVGESGSGKTTLGRCLLGLEQLTSGHVTIDGIDASDYSSMPADDRRKVRRTVQMVFQDPYSTLNPARTVGATLREALAAGDSSRRGGPVAIETLLERVGLPPAYAKRKPVALSGGERQRVAIARALAVNPRLIVCDEAVSALDVSVQAQILNLLAELRRQTGTALLFITHDLAVVRQIADRLVVLRHGEVVETGPCDEVLDHPRHSYTRSLIESVPR